MSDGTDDTTIGRGGWALVIASAVISFVLLRFPMHYQLFPSIVFAVAIALVVLLVLIRLAVAVNRHDDAEVERQVRKIVPASSLGEGATRVRGVEGAQGSTVVAVPMRPDPSVPVPQRPAAVVTPLSRVESAPIISPKPVTQPVTAPTAPPTPSTPSVPVAEPADTFADLPDVWARPARAPAVPPAPIAAPAPAPAAGSKPKAGFKTKADLAAAAAEASAADAAAPKSKAEPKAKVATKAKAEAKAKAEPKSKAEPKPKPDTKAEAKPKAPPAKAKAAAKPKAAKAVPAALVRLSAPRNGVADDLKEIEGIGPAIEKLVNGLGFYHFDQIAAWTGEDVAKVDAELRTFKGRIERDKWVEQAKIITTEGLMAFRERAKTNDY